MSRDVELGSKNVTVRCQSVTKHYGQGDTLVHALRGVDLEISQGEMMMVVGPSGCGKTTLISVIAGILDADSGQCLVLDQEMSALSRSEKTVFRRDNVGFIFQAYNLIPTISVVTNVMVPLLLQNYSQAEARERASQILIRVGLGDKLKSRSNDLSGGQQQRVAIARALIHNPKLIVCDEPTSALDHVNGAKIMELFRSIVDQEKCTLIVVTHDSRIFRYADRFAEMDDGAIQSIKSGAEAPIH